MKTNMKTNDFSAKKSLGQNFLNAPHIIDTMIRTARIHPGLQVLEVGPGKGVLTEKLVEAGAHVTAVEKDDRAIAFLKEKFAGEIVAGKLKLVHRDILDIDVDMKNGGLVYRDLVCGEYIVVANIPYYITGEFLRKILESSCQPKQMTLMLQKEVAERIAVNTKTTGTTGEKTGKESILSISVKVYGQPSYIETVPARLFEPAPKVDSAVLSIDNISKNFFKVGNATDFYLSEKDFFAIVKAGFSHKRKFLIKNLAQTFNTEDILQSIWQKNAFPISIRAEELTIDDWKNIAVDLHKNGLGSFDSTCISDTI